jgi:hypothetical protein
MHREASHISIPRGVGARRMPIRWHLHQILPRDRRRADQIRAKGVSRHLRGRTLPRPIAGSTNRNESNEQNHQEAGNSHTGSSNKPNYTPKPGSKNWQTDGQIPRSKPDQPQSFGALGTGWGRAVIRAPSMRSSLLTPGPSPRHNKMILVPFSEQACGKLSPKL